MINILDSAKSYYEELITHRRYLHENAETHINLPITTKYVMEQLTNMGYEPIEISKSGVLAIAGGKKKGKTFLIRGDMDALPLKEQTGLSFSSKTDNMHACGHDFHTAMLLGAAKILKEKENEIEGTVKLMFQPGEETLTGAKAMIKAGILKKPDVDAAMMIHVFSGMPIKKGAVIFFGKGAVSATSDWFYIDIKGKGGHGAMPNTTVDPLNVAAHIHIALANINSREIDPDQVGVVTVGQMHGGTTGNIIPDTAFLEGTIRTFDDKTRIFINRRVKDITEGIANTFRAKATVKFSNACPSVVNDSEVFNNVFTSTMDLVGPEKCVDLEVLTGKPFRMPGSEDFAFISEKVPSLLLAMDASLYDGQEVFPQHHPKVNFDESVLPTGAAVYANAAITWLKDNK